MKLTNLQIQLQPSYSDNAGKYIATVEYEEGRQNAVKLVLDPEISMKLLAFVGPAITAAAAAAARQIEANIIGALEASKPTLEIEAPAAAQEPETNSENNSETSLPFNIRI